MTKHLIADTNVFYYLASGKLAKADFVAASEVLCYSPITVIELSSKLTGLSLAERQAVAKAILDSHARLLPDPELFLTTVFGNQANEKPFDWSQGLKAITQAKSMKELLAGVKDYSDRVVRKVSVQTVGSWRETTEQQWYGDMLKIMSDEIPGFKRWYKPDAAKRRGEKPRLRGPARAKFLAGTKTEEWFTTLLVACQDRSFYKAKRSVPFQPTTAFVQKLVASIDKMACYCCVYTQYLVKLLTEGMMPQPHDSGDIELFIYSVNDDNIVVTAEKRWLDLATRAGFQQRVRKV